MYKHFNKQRMMLCQHHSGNNCTSLCVYRTRTVFSTTSRPIDVYERSTDQSINRSTQCLYCLFSCDECLCLRKSQRLCVCFLCAVHSSNFHRSLEQWMDFNITISRICQNDTHAYPYASIVIHQCIESVKKKFKKIGTVCFCCWIQMRNADYRHTQSK